eukprot:TRINITY_DN4216_c0_g1_i1.p1 TRINITY_DN4216_c0_g1~~TRINITY_DN4216_c0_g1_i1.p1  ORF type:complete len:382 (+),score=118.72 TRINITY_DN4216_c0_g1_i1:75-1220(+)
MAAPPPPPQQQQQYYPMAPGQGGPVLMPPTMYPYMNVHPSLYPFQAVPVHQSYLPPPVYYTQQEMEAASRAGMQVPGVHTSMGMGMQRAIDKMSNPELVDRLCMAHSWDKQCEMRREFERDLLLDLFFEKYKAELLEEGKDRDRQGGPGEAADERSTQNDGPAAAQETVHYDPHGSDEEGFDRHHHHHHYYVPDGSDDASGGSHYFESGNGSPAHRGGERQGGSGRGSGRRGPPAPRKGKNGQWKWVPGSTEDDFKAELEWDLEIRRGLFPEYRPHMKGGRECYACYIVYRRELARQQKMETVRVHQAVEKERREERREAAREASREASRDTNYSIFQSDLDEVNLGQLAGDIPPPPMMPPGRALKARKKPTTFSKTAPRR